MFRFFFSHPSLGGYRASLGQTLQAILTVLLLAVAAVPTALLGAPVASAHTGDTTTDQAVLRDSPAVVRIVSEMIGALVCHACASDGSDIVSPQDPRQQPFVWASSGSGAFISPDGYILTADHVVDDGLNNPDDVNFVLQMAAQDISQRYNLDPNSVLAFLMNHPNQVQVEIQVVSQTVFLSTAYTGQLQNTAQMISYPITRIVVNSPIDKQDTAIIKVAAQDMPNLTLADASDVTTGETITSIAFPGDADQVTANGGGSGNFFPLLDPSHSDAGTMSALLTSTVETGQITAQKTAGGTLYYETSAIANHGSSGGPVIDEQGRLIGFVDQGSDTGRVVTLVSSSVAAEYVRQAGVTNSGQGAFETLWAKAVNEYASTSACHFTNAAADLNKLRDNYPAFGGVEPLLKNAQTKAPPGDCAPSNPNLLLFGAIGGGLVLVIMITLLVLLLVRRRGQLQSVPAPVGAGYSQVPAMLPSAPPQARFAQPSVGQPPAPSLYQQGAAPVAATPWYVNSPDATVLPGQPLYAAAPPGYQPTPDAGAYSSYAYPASPGSAAAMPPQAGGQYPGAGHPSGPPVYQQAPAPTALVCANGHAVPNANMQFCPDCGAPVQSLLHR